MKFWVIAFLCFVTLSSISYSLGRSLYAVDWKFDAKLKAFGCYENLPKGDTFYRKHVDSCKDCWQAFKTDGQKLGTVLVTSCRDGVPATNDKWVDFLIKR